MAPKIKLPENLHRLEDLAYNMWWSWNQSGIDLFRRIDPELWEKVGHNPVRLLQEVPFERLEQLADSDYLVLYHRVLADFDAYMHPETTWFQENHPDRSEEPHV
jgi:starch phosphorylase